MIIPCNCSGTDAAKFQDAQYGHGNRVHNYARGAFNKVGGWRCTLCLALKPASAAVMTKATTPVQSK